jgi:hypothetical protein
MLHIILSVILFVLVIKGVWIPAALLALFLLWKYHAVITVLVAGILYDALFGMFPAQTWYGYVGTISALVFVIVFYSIKKVVRS